MPFITPIADADALDDVAALYDDGKTQFGYLPNMYKAFSLRPEYWAAWGPLLSAIRDRMDPRRYEVATVGAAVAMKSSYCALAHGGILARDLMDAASVADLVADPDQPGIDPVDRAVFRFAQAVVRDASGVSQADVEDLRSLGLDDGEIADVAAAASVRCFFSKFLDALGFAPDAAYANMPASLRDVLVVGRDIDTE